MLKLKPPHVSNLLIKRISERINDELKTFEKKLNSYEANDVVVRVEVGLSGAKGFVQAKLKKAINQSPTTCI